MSEEIVQSRTPDYAEAYAPSDDQERADEIALRNAGRTAAWRDSYEQELQQAARRRQQRLTRMRLSWVERRRRVRMRTVRR